MGDAIITLNAGSSSLKFSIYRVAGEQLEVAARGQIEGLGTTPRFKAKDGEGRQLPEAQLAASASGFGHPEAFAHLAEWAGAQFRSELTPVAIGHRVVHGGLDFVEPTL